MHNMQLDTSFQRDYATLRSISASIEELRKEMETARLNIHARDRGYFLPKEDDWAKRLILAYRNYRIAVYDIISRREDYEERDPVENASTFLVGFAAAVMLYHWSSMIVEDFKDVKQIRDKLNEGDLRYGIEPDLFDSIYRNLTRVSIQERLAAAVDHYTAWHEQFTRMFPVDSEQSWLIKQIEERRDGVAKDPMGIWKRRIKRDLDVTFRRAAKPFAAASYKIQSFLFDIFGNVWLDHKPSIPIEHLDQFAALARPGDFFLVRPERKSSTVFLPGWWTHAAVYFGGKAGLASIGACELPCVSEMLPRVIKSSPTGPRVIAEALSPGVVLNSMIDATHVDHAALFRPMLPNSEIAAGLDNVFGHLGKPYDFEFDFRRADRLVCTELVYRAYDGRGDIRFEPKERFGHPTLSADDIVEQIVRQTLSGGSPIQLLAMSHKSMTKNESEFLQGDAAFERIRTTVVL